MKTPQLLPSGKTTYPGESIPPYTVTTQLVRPAPALLDALATSLATGAGENVTRTNARLAAVLGFDPASALLLAGHHGTHAQLGASDAQRLSCLPPLQAVGWLWTKINRDPLVMSPTGRIQSVLALCRNSPSLCYVLLKLLQYKHDNERCLVAFDSHWAQELTLLCTSLLGLRVGCIRAGNKPAERTRLTEEFNDPTSNMDAFFLTLALGSYGVNFHRNCHRGLIAQFSFSFNVLHQFVGRLVRMGQSQKVTVEIIKCDGTRHHLQEAALGDKWVSQLASTITLPAGVADDLARLALAEVVKAHWGQSCNRLAWAVRRPPRLTDWETEDVVQLGHFLSRVTAMGLTAGGDLGTRLRSHLRRFFDYADELFALEKQPTNAEDLLRALQDLVRRRKEADEAKPATPRPRRASKHKAPQTPDAAGDDDDDDADADDDTDRSRQKPSGKRAAAVLSRTVVNLPRRNLLDSDSEEEARGEAAFSLDQGDGSPRDEVALPATPMGPKAAQPALSPLSALFSEPVSSLPFPLGPLSPTVEVALRRTSRPTPALASPARSATLVPGDTDPAEDQALPARSRLDGASSDEGDEDEPVLAQQQGHKRAGSKLDGRVVHKRRRMEIPDTEGLASSSGDERGIDIPDTESITNLNDEEDIMPKPASGHVGSSSDEDEEKDKDDDDLVVDFLNMEGMDDGDEF
ncbi:hypothetical protein SCUCBS95973_009915 [Sporothrix curviconia]|uniref:Helicase C-terminal domain-containing protein n=1 Tax=Sporothrix curviconia TaxID=1260050 RepID=A0ABP0D2H3_9PEZI